MTDASFEQDIVNSQSEYQAVCRHCGTELKDSVVDLGSSPLCNSLLQEQELDQAETFYPLHARVCGNCFLVQVGEFVAPDAIFTEYSYFSSFSDTLVEHAREFVESAVKSLKLDKNSLVIEVASNDGYLLQHFRPLNIPVLGVEPAKNVAAAASDKGIRTISEFLGAETAETITREYGKADLAVANNVVAHTPYLNDFVKGLANLLKPTGVVSVEFAHVLAMLEDGLYDTIYHEHFSYLSLCTIEKVMASQGLTVFDAEEIATHGGSVRVWAVLAENPSAETDRLQSLRGRERSSGVSEISTYTNFKVQVEKSKRDLLNCLIDLRARGLRVVGYGVPGKGNTLLNYCGIRTDFLDYMVDRNPYKQGRYTPGTRIPIRDPQQIELTKPDYILIMPWNLVDEITDQLDHVRDWGCKFIVPLPAVRVIA